MLYRESNKLMYAKNRVDRMQRDERLDEDAEIMGQTLLEKIRAEDKTAALTMEQKERKLQSKQRKMRKFVKQSL